MNNQLIKKEKLSIFDKMKKLIKRLFVKENSQIMEIENIENMENNTLKEDLKVDISLIDEKENRLKNFFKTIETNPDMVEKLTDDGLDKIISYYEKVTFDKKEKIKKLKASLN